MDSKREADWACESCRDPFPEDRLCGETPLGNCSKHGDFNENEAEFSDELSRYVCPECGGKLRWKFTLYLGSKYIVHSCPVGRIDPRAIFWVKIVNWSESTGCMPNPGGLLDQANSYFEIRNVVVRERSIAEEELRPKDDKPSETQKQGGVYKIPKRTR